MLQRLFATYSRNSRNRRARVFLDRLRPSTRDRILDLGSEDGRHIAALLPYRENVYLADIRPDLLERGQREFGFRNIVVLGEEGTLPFPDAYFDVVFCSSVIEHVTVDKRDTELYYSNRGFAQAALERQRRFAQEIRRISKRYYVQTPNKYFPIESHTWLPMVIVFMPRRLQAATIRFFNRFWPKKTQPDWHLLTMRRMRELFPDAEIVTERSFGFTKSLMAIKS